MKKLALIILLIGFISSCKGKIIIDIIREIWSELSKDSGGPIRETNKKIYFRHANRYPSYDSLKICKIISKVRIPDSIVPHNEKPVLLIEGNTCSYVYYNLTKAEINYAKKHMFELPKEIQKLSRIHIFPSAIQNLSWSPEKGYVFLNHFSFYPNFENKKEIIIDSVCVFGWSFSYHAWLNISVSMTCADDKNLIIMGRVREQPVYSLYKFPYFLGNMKLIIDEFLDASPREPEYYGYDFEDNKFTAIFIDTSIKTLEPVVISLIKHLPKKGWDVVDYFQSDTLLKFKMRKHFFTIRGNYTFKSIKEHILKTTISSDTIIYIDTQKYYISRSIIDK